MVLVVEQRMSNYIGALEIQGRVIKALFLREMKTRFGETRLGFVWAFIEPIIHVLSIILIWDILGRMGPQGINTILFLVTGVVPFIMFSNILNKTMNSIAGNKALLVFPQIKPIDFIISRIVVEFTTYIMVFLGFVLGCIYFNIDTRIENVLGVFTQFTLIALLGGGIGYILMPLTSMFRVTQYIVSFAIKALYLSSGIIFAIERLPLYITKYLSWNPLLQIIYMLRADFFPQLHPRQEFGSIWYVISLIAISWLFGIVLTKRTMIHIMTEK